MIIDYYPHIIEEQQLFVSLNLCIILLSFNKLVIKLYHKFCRKNNEQNL